MKRVLVGASILVACMTTATGMAAADTQPSNRVSGVEIAGTTGSSQDLEVLLWQLGLGSSNPWCDNPMHCMPPTDVNAPIVGSGSAAPVAGTSTGSADLASVIGTYGGLIGWMQGGSSSRPRCGGMCGIG
ncbi:hypothetical protein [Nocardia sp. A7]|uniref:hypothetical protein n=1 Tax=Nocardia sp. A7 TaxID=2789274 RepID=UPI00397D1988